MRFNILSAALVVLVAWSAHAAPVCGHGRIAVWRMPNFAQPIWKLEGNDLMIWHKAEGFVLLAQGSSVGVYQTLAAAKTAGNAAATQCEAK